MLALGDVLVRFGSEATAADLTAGSVPSGPDDERRDVPNDPLSMSSQATQWLIAVRDRRDRDAFGQLFDYFGPKIKAMLIRGGLRDGSAEDVLQDVMLVIWHKAGQFDPHRAEASAWIYRIARNRSIDLVRRRPPIEPDQLDDRPSGDADAEQILALGQETTRLRHALKAIPPDQAQVLEQAYFQDLPHSQIAHATGLPLGTIKSRIRMGLERLRRELNDLRQP